MKDEEKQMKAYVRHDCRCPGQYLSTEHSEYESSVIITRQRSSVSLVKYLVFLAQNFRKCTKHQYLQKQRTSYVHP